MALTQLKSPAAAARWLDAWVTGTLRTDSRQVQPGDGFIAWPGQTTDGRHHVASALAAGAATCLVEADGVEAFGFDDARIAALPAMRAATGPIADAFFQQPSRALRMLAVTGTNGKTSSTWWLAQSLSLLGQRCAVVGTLGVGQPPSPAEVAAGVARGERRDGTVEATGLTTPDPVRLQVALRGFVDQGFAACAMEASSIGLTQQRLAGTAIHVALFTNFTPDHLDFHGSMDAYWQAKRTLFDWPGLQAAVINIDDPQGAALAETLTAEGRLAVWTYSTQTAARLRASDLSHRAEGLAFDVQEHADAGAGVGTALGAGAVPADTHVALQTGLIGDYNVSNLLGVLGGLRALGIDLKAAAAVAAQVTPVPGRMQRVPAAAGLPEVVVDYAHTPDALDKALSALRPLAAARGGRLWCVFGCGGNRDVSKRALMGAAAARGADSVVVTSDNPRTEAPGDIIRQIIAGLSAALGANVSADVGADMRAGMPTEATTEPRGPADWRAIEDRRTAIATAVAQAAANDVILLAGKGHEDYQDIGGVKLPFDDAVEARAALARRAEEPACQ
jgi:UDP-N-acetylmuramoyl-L-alanyl-D-glutamate--2,6-diaminopimelate ligase